MATGEAALSLGRLGRAAQHALPQLRRLRADRSAEVALAAGWACRAIGAERDA